MDATACYREKERLSGVAGSLGGISFRMYNESKRRDLRDWLCMWTSLICIPVSDSERLLQLWCLLSHEFPTSLPSAFAKNALECSPISQSTETVNSFFITERSTTQSANGFQTEDGCWEACEAWRKMFFLPDKALQVQRGALFGSSFLHYCSPNRESPAFVSYGLQSLRLWHLIKQNLAMLPLLITVMLQETERGERCVWQYDSVKKQGVIKQGSSQTSLLLTLCVCVSLWPLSEGGNKIVLYCSTSLTSNNKLSP